MRLVHPHVVALNQIDEVLSSVFAHDRVALILVGKPVELSHISDSLLQKRKNLVVLHVDLEDADVTIALTNPRLGELLNAVRALLQGDEGQSIRISEVQLSSPVSYAASTPKGSLSHTPDQPPLFVASVNWIHRVYRDAISQVSTEHGDVHGISVTRETLLEILNSSNKNHGHSDESEENLTRVFKQSLASNSEPLAIAVNSLEIGFLEFKFLLLTLSPELGNSIQRCIGYLLDDMSRRIGTMGLYCSLLGRSVDVRASLSQLGNLSRWHALIRGPSSVDEAGESLGQPKRCPTSLLRIELREIGAVLYQPIRC